MSKFKCISTCCAGLVIALTVASSTVAMASTDQPAIDVLKTIENVAPEAISSSANVVTTAFGDSAISAEISNVKIDVPTTASNPIEVSGENGSITIGLPFGHAAEQAVTEKPGTVSYNNKNGSTTVPTVRDDGTVQVNTVIASSSSPTEYKYSLGIPTGAKLVADGQMVGVVADDGSVVGYFDAPWALDANGQKVATRYEVRGHDLIQVVEHQALGVAYPVVADPKYSALWWGAAVKLTNAETRALKDNYGPAYFVNAFCTYAGPFAPACALGVNIRLWTWQKPVNDAAAQGRCAQLNLPWGSGPVLWNVTNEQC